MTSQAEARYDQNLEAAIANVEEILETLKRKRRADSDIINWGHVGDAAHALQLSNEMKESLT
jgi:hypothetical protein